MPAEPAVPSLLGDPPDDLKGFPRYRLRRGAVIHRNHPAARGPWWFNDGGEGRFDLSGGRGTCYLAHKPVGGLLEAFKGHRAITEEVLAHRAEFSVKLRRELALANCCVVRAAQFGVNAEIHTTSDYDKTQGWAAALAAAGLDGIRYFLRSDPSLKLIGYALFGDAGEARAGAWPPGSTSAVSARTVREAARYGLKVLPTP